MAVMIRGRTLSLPILQGGMGVGVSLERLAGAVAACGGMGTISTAVCGFNEPDFAADPRGANLRALAAHGDCIIVGRNADLILAEHRPLKLFVYADLESRLRRCRERSSDDERFTLRELERKLRQVDQHRARHHAMLSDLPWGSREGYHLCVNTTGLSLKTLAPLVAEYARSWFSQQGTP